MAAQPQPSAQRPGAMTRVAAVGHVEWVQFARVPHVPRAGEVEHAREAFEEPAGGGAVAAVQLARLAGGARLLTALGEDEVGERSLVRLGELGVEVAHATRREPTRRAVTLTDDRRERTIVTFGERLEPHGGDPLPWAELEQVDAVYFTAGDADALRAARAARVLVASPRARHALGQGIPIDALVYSADDEIEREAARSAEADASLVVLTDGARGGTYRTREGHTGSWAAAKPPGDPVDSYGCGDSFAAGFAYGLGVGLTLDEALALAARCGAYCLTGRGPYTSQLTASELARPAGG